MTTSAFWTEAWTKASTAALVNHLWQSTVIALIALPVALTLRNNHARTRYWVWMIASIKFLVPFSIFISAGEWIRFALVTPIQAPAFAAAVEQIALPFPKTEFFAPAGLHRLFILQA